MLDRSRPLTDDDRALLEADRGAPRVVVVNKCDLPAAWDARHARDRPRRDECGDGLTRVISAKTGAGLDDLIAAIARALGAAETQRDRPRDHQLASRDAARTRARRAAASAPARSSGIDLRRISARSICRKPASALQEITGRRTTDDLLQHIFKNFCIGK